MSDNNQKSKSIPKWFCRNKYDSGKKAPLVDWAFNLDFRESLLQEISFQAKDGVSLDREYTMKCYEMIREQGFINRADIETVDHAVELETNRPGWGLVIPLSLYDAFDIYENIRLDTELRNKMALVEYQEIFHHERTEPLRKGEEKLKNWYLKTSRATSYDDTVDDGLNFQRHLTIDLGALDSTIIDAFKDWLKTTRKENDLYGSQLPEKISSKQVEKWINSAILPYLDILIYQKIERIELPLHVIGNAIFDDSASFDTTEAVRKTTRPNAKKALKQAYTILRHALVIEELQKSGKKVF